MRISRQILFLISLLVSLCRNCCGKPSRTSEEDKSRIRFAAPVANDMAEEPTVLFELKPSQAPASPPNWKQYDCTYSARGKTAKFKIRLAYGALTGSEFPVASGEGEFISVKGLENLTLLEDLMPALDAKSVPMNINRLASLRFSAVVLGEKLHRDPAGGFSSKPPGDWTSIKIFLPKDGDDGEVFLHLNTVSGEGEFSLKDPDYGDYVLRELAKVL